MADLPTPSQNVPARPGTKAPVRSAAAPGPAAAAAAKKPPVKRVPAKTAARRTPAKPRRGFFERARSMRFRLLPITIFAAVLMLGVRMGDLWRLATHDATLPEFPATMAQNAPATNPPPAAKDPIPPPAADANTGQPGSAPAADKPAADAGGLPPGPIDNEELAKRYAERRADLERRTKELEMKEALLNAAEKRIDQKVQEMDKVRTEIQQMMKAGEDKQNAQADALVAIYEKMKPKDAARIFDEMDLPQLLDVVPRMKDSKSALVLAAMNPVKAKELTTALLAKRVQPAIPQ